VNDGRCFFQPMRASDVNSVTIAIPYQLHSGEGMVPTKVHAADARPMRRKLFMLDSDGRFRNRENPPRTKNRNPFSPGFEFVRGVWTR
jgi:hypothetical protein